MGHYLSEYYNKKTFFLTLGLAKSKSKYYRNILKDDIFKKIETIEDIIKLPITSSKELRDKPLDFLMQGIKEIFHVISSSGTTGYPKISFLTKYLDLSLNDISDEVVGINEDDIIVMLIHRSEGGNFSAPLRWRKKGLKVIQVEPALAETNPMFVLTFLRKSGATIIKGSVNAIYKLTKKAVLEEIDLSKLVIKKIILSGSSLTINMRRHFSDNWKKNIFTTYGCNEVGNIATECKAHDGLHINTNSVLVEIVDTKNNLPVREGEKGKVLITTLANNQNIVLLRYDIGDLGFVKYEKCRCGIAGPKIWLLGRIGEVLLIGQGLVEVYPHDIFNIIKDSHELTGRFKLTVEGTKGKKETVYVDFETFEKKIGRKENILNNIEIRFFEIFPQLRDDNRKGNLKIIFNLTGPETMLKEWGRKPQSLLIDNRIR